MADGVNVRFPEKIKAFVEERSRTLYGSTGESIRDLVRRDYEGEEARRWSWLESQLKPGIEADATEFTEMNADEVIARNRK